MSDDVRRLWLKSGGVVEVAGAPGQAGVTLLVQNHDGECADVTLLASEAEQVLAAVTALVPKASAGVLVQETSLGRIGFDAYGNAPGPHGPWKTFDGRAIPQWESLRAGMNDDGTPNAGGPLTCERWEVAALEVVAAADSRLARELCAELSRYCGEAGHGGNSGEGAVETLQRLLGELNAYRSTHTTGLQNPLEQRVVAAFEAGDISLSAAGEKQARTEAGRKLLESMTAEERATSLMAYVAREAHRRNHAAAYAGGASIALEDDLTTVDDMNRTEPGVTTLVIEGVVTTSDEGPVAPDLPKPLALGGKAHEIPDEEWVRLGPAGQRQHWADVFNRGLPMDLTDEELRAKIAAYLDYWLTPREVAADAGEGPERP